MTRLQAPKRFDAGFIVRKFFVSAFIVFTFVAYAIHERRINPDGTIPVSAPEHPTPNNSEAALPTDLLATNTTSANALSTDALLTSTPTLSSSATNIPTLSSSATDVPTLIPSATDVPTLPPPTAVPTQYIPTAVPPTAVPAVAQGQYKDGQYTGSSANAYYGTVQVKTIIQGGRITDVQFLNWPADRRTSQRINAQAMPYLTSEAIQAQSAQVNIISGATLTSHAFILSLQSALSRAKA